MAAPETQVIGSNVVVLADSNVVGGQLGATLNYNANAVEILDKDSGVWPESIKGVGEWSIDLNAAHTEGDGTHVLGADGNAGLDITYDSTTYTITDLDSLTMELSATASSVAGLDDALWQYQRITQLAMSLDLSGAYQDPYSTLGEGYGALFDAEEAGDTVDFDFTFGGLTLSGTARPGTWTLDAPPAGDNATIDFSLRQEGAVTSSGSIDTGLQVFIDKFLNRTKVTALVQTNDDTGSKLDGAAGFSGDTWITSLSLEATRGEELTQAITLTGDGPLTRAAQTVV